MATWPTTLPRPTVDAYALTLGDPVARTAIGTGRRQARERFARPGTEIAVRWVFSEVELAVFEAWYRYIARDGAAWFDCELADGQGVVTWGAQFAEKWRLAAGAGLSYAVSAKLWVRARPVVA